MGPKEKLKIRQGDLKDKTEQETENRKKIDENNLSHEIASCCSLHETKAKKQAKKDKQKQGEKQENKEGRKPVNNKRDRE